MRSIDSLTLEVADTAAAEHFYKAAFGLDGPLRFRASEEPTSGFRGYSMSVIVDRPATAKAFLDAALAAGATSIKPAAKSLWGYGGVVQAPDGAIWKVVTPHKKEDGPDTGTIDQLVLLLGVADVKATKQFYVDRGFEVERSFGRKYAEFKAGPDSITLGLYGRRALAKDAGVDGAGTGSHRLVINSDAGSFTDLDGFSGES
ncbi:glyoxalase [Mumia sp. Pv 4-285]|uniref:glyoxalase n=1 Tax=Mumia qirimensis TaxID=3234852 RepID=UPI00351CE8CC